MVTYDFVAFANIWLHFFIAMSDVMKWKIVGEGFGMKKGEKRRTVPGFELLSWRVVTLQNYINYNDKLNELYGSVLFLYVCMLLLTYLKNLPRLITSIKKRTIVKTNCFWTKRLRPWNQKQRQQRIYIYQLDWLWRRNNLHIWF